MVMKDGMHIPDDLRGFIRNADKITVHGIDFDF